MSKSKITKKELKITIDEVEPEAFIKFSDTPAGNELGFFKDGENRVTFGRSLNPHEFEVLKYCRICRKARPISLKR